MTEREELQAILGVMLLECFPERAREVIKSLRIMAASARDIIKTHNIEEGAEGEFLKTISDSLAFMANNANVDYP